MTKFTTTKSGDIDDPSVYAERICSNCAFWSDGACSGVSLVRRNEVMIGNDMGMYCQGYDQYDDSGPPEFRTGPLFGCVLFKQKKGTEREKI